MTNTAPATDGVPEPAEPGWYAYSGGGEVMIFHLRLSPAMGRQWSVHLDDGTAADCAWGYIEQALGVWDLVPLRPGARRTERETCDAIEGEVWAWLNRHDAPWSPADGKVRDLALHLATQARRMTRRRVDAAPLEPHPFEGRLDRGCEHHGCGLPDRALVHKTPDPQPVTVPGARDERVRREQQPKRPPRVVDGHAEFTFTFWHEVPWAARCKPCENFKALAAFDQTRPRLGDVVEHWTAVWRAAGRG